MQTSGVFLGCNSLWFANCLFALCSASWSASLTQAI